MTRMTRTRLFALLAVSSFALGACSAQPEPAPPATALEVRVAPLELTGIGDARYTIVVDNGAGQTVWTATVNADTFGDGAGSISYVGPCDASANPHTVTLTLDALYDTAGDLLVSPSDYKDPGPITLADITCQENRDTLVLFDLTILRAAEQGFFDVAVNFSDVFCSAKVDCQEAFLHDTDGERGATVVIGFACTSGSGLGAEPEPTWLYLSAITLTCVDPAGVLPPLTQTIIPSSASTGGGQQGPAPPLLFEWAQYAGDEALPGLDKCYWNHALGLDLEVIGPRVCTLTALGTASDAPLPGSAIGPAQTYPIIGFDVEVVGAGGALCDNNALDTEGSGVVTGYVTPTTTPHPPAFVSAHPCDDAPPPPPVGLACLGGDDMLLQPTLGPSGEAAVIVTVDGVPSNEAYLLPPDTTLGSTCCLAGCCQP